MESLFRPFKWSFGEVPQLLLLLESRGHAFQTARSLATLGKSLWGEHKEAPKAKHRPEAAHPKESSDLSKPKGTLLKKFWRQFRAQALPPGTTDLQGLRNDDFPRKKRVRAQVVLPVERSDGSEMLFGIAPCSLALATSKRSFSRLFLKAGVTPTTEAFSRQAEDRKIPVQTVPRKVLDRLSHGGVHQGVCLEATPLHPTGWTQAPAHRLEGATTEEAPQLLWLALEGIQDPMNLGAVLRSAHFLGVDGIVMSRKNSCPLTPVVSKASSGAMEVLDVFSADDLPGFLKVKSKEGWEVLGTVAHAKAQDGIPVVSCLDFRWMKPTILVLGNEGHGLSPETKSLCRRMLTIAPGRELEPGIESLNVSVAAGILLHSICAQKVKAP
uniref:rRNA methyltransferase 1, mitochondrial n=1 Tax=Anolis carolinensis TaxID=28377 RepID=H9G6C9_ANOCA